MVKIKTPKTSLLSSDTVEIRHRYLYVKTSPDIADASCSKTALGKEWEENACLKRRIVQSHVPSRQIRYNLLIGIIKIMKLYILRNLK